VTAGLAVGGLARSAGFRAHSRTEGTVTGWGFAGGLGVACHSSPAQGATLNPGPTLTATGLIAAKQ
jgi:hypothetical protein